MAPTAFALSLSLCLVKLLEYIPKATLKVCSLICSLTHSWDKTPRPSNQNSFGYISQDLQLTLEQPSPFLLKNVCAKTLLPLSNLKAVPSTSPHDNKSPLGWELGVWVCSVMTPSPHLYSNQTQCSFKRIPDSHVLYFLNPCLSW